MWYRCGVVCSFRGGVSSCPLVRGFRTFRTCHRLALVLWCRVPAFCPPFSLCLWSITFGYAFISRFKGVFRGFGGEDVYLCGLRYLRGLWGFCVREWLGGFMACCVFASILYLLPCFLSCCLCFPLVVVLCSGCIYLFSCFVFVALWVCCCFLFPCGRLQT